MKTRTQLCAIILVGLYLLTSCNLLTIQDPTSTPSPTSTPDPSSMDIQERTIWNLENFLNEVNDLSAIAADTPVEELDPINRKMALLAAQIKNYEIPLEAATMHSVLYNYAFLTAQCYMIRFDVHINEMSDEEYDYFFGDFDRCERAHIFEETCNLYLQELKETYSNTTPIATSTNKPRDTPPIPTSTFLPTPIPEHLRKQTMDEYIAAIDPLLSDWYENTEKLNKVRYQYIIEDLPRLRNEFASLEINPSFNIMHARMIQYMDCQIASYLTLIGPEGIESMNFDTDPKFYFENCTFNFE